MANLWPKPLPKSLTQALTSVISRGAWNAIRARVHRSPCVALLTDLDGTLAAIQHRPYDVRIPASVRRNLAKIARDGTLVGVVSGRGLEDVVRIVGIRGIWYAGAHGFFLQTPGNRKIALANPNKIRQISQIRARLERALHTVPGIWLEDKQATIAVHYRGASRRGIELAALTVRRVLGDARGLHLLKGKKVWEILPGREIDKASAIRLILRTERYTAPRGPRLVFYLGDDATDERVFEKLRGISVVVGRRQNTAARFFLRSPREVARFLSRWGELRR